MSVLKILRLLEFDDSKEFKIIVHIKEDIQNENNIQVSKESNITINTTINKARVISKNINEIYIVDQTIDHYEIELNNIQEKNKTRKVVEVFNLLLNSIGQEININEELGLIFLIIEYQLGEEPYDNKNNTGSNNNNNNNNDINDYNNNNNNNNNNENKELGYSDLLFMYKYYK